MEIKFFRKLNALSIRNARTKVPTKAELIENLINKLAEKVHQIEVIFTKSLRDEYLTKKNKFEESLALSEDKLKSLLAERVTVDLLQLFIDISKFYNIQITSKTAPKTKTERQIKDELEKLIPNLLIPKNIDDSLLKLYNLIFSYSTFYGFQIKDIETKQQLIQKTEGSFFEGLFVIFEQ